MPKSFYIKAIATLGILVPVLAACSSAGGDQQLPPAPTVAAREGPAGHCHKAQAPT